MDEICAAKTPLMVHGVLCRVDHNQGILILDLDVYDRAQTALGIVTPGEVQSFYALHSGTDLLWLNVMLVSDLLRDPLADPQPLYPDRGHGTRR